MCPHCTGQTQEYFKGKGKGTNPRGANGLPLKCDHCGSEKHLWRKCDAPGHEEYKQRRLSQGGKGRGYISALVPTEPAPATVPNDSYKTALQQWQSLTGQPTSQVPIRNFFAIEAAERRDEEDYCPEMVGTIDDLEDGSRLCESQSRPGETRRYCASATSWDVLSMPGEFAQIEQETQQIIEAAFTGTTETSATPADGQNALKWFMGPVFERHGETQQVFLEATRITGKECLLIDPGAYDNLVGSRWVERQGELARLAHLKPIQKPMRRSIGVEGVGSNSQEAKDEVIMPGAAVDVRGLSHQISYQAPVVPDSNIPALWGQRSLARQRSILDMVNRKLYLCGPGRIQFTPPPGTSVFNLEMSQSGHLMLPISEFLGQGRDAKVREKHKPASWHATDRSTTPDTASAGYADAYDGSTPVPKSRAKARALALTQPPVTQPPVTPGSTEDIETEEWLLAAPDTSTQ